MTISYEPEDNLKKMNHTFAFQCSFWHLIPIASYMVCDEPQYKECRGNEYTWQGNKKKDYHQGFFLIPIFFLLIFWQQVALKCLQKELIEYS